VAEETVKRRVTAADIARSLGISRATVGFVLNQTPGQTISDATRRRVLDEAARLGYRPHTAAQALASGKSRIILLVLPDWPIEHSMSQALGEASLVLDRAGYSLVTYTRHDGGRARPLWDSLNPDVVFGYTPFSADDIASLHACGITAIIPEPGQRHDLGDTAVISTGPRLQVEHLHALGHTRLAYACSADPRVEQLSVARARSAQAAAAALGLPPLDEQAVDSQDGSARRAVRHWREQRITGVVAYNDDIAAAVIGAAVRAGVDVPAKLAVVGHDDSPITSLFVPSISSVHVDASGLGRYLAEIALHKAAGQPLQVGEPSVEATVVVRESTSSRTTG
jgi:DNA-binding LacI/PurR family transcriptional regulator